MVNVVVNFTKKEVEELKKALETTADDEQTDVFKWTLVSDEDEEINVLISVGNDFYEEDQY